MRYKNNIVTGILAGLILPALAWLLFGVIFKDVVFMNKPGIPYLVAVAINLVGVRYGFRNDMDKTATGLVVTSFIVVGLVFILKIQPA
jgi:hypothetical protein